MSSKDIETIVALVSEDPAGLDRVNPNADWNRIFLLALWHKVAFIVFERLRESGLLDQAISKGRFPLLLANHWSQLVGVNELRHAHYLAELKTIDAALAARDIIYAVGKGGPILIPEIYSPYERKMYDVDLLADRAAAPSVIEAMQSIGYQMGEYDRRTRTLQPLGNDELRTWLLHSRGLPNFVNIADTRLIDHAICQVQFSVGDTKSGKTRPAGVLLEGRLRKDDFWMIPRSAVLTQLGLHIYREFKDESFHHWGMGLNLIKLSDLSRWVDHLSDNDLTEAISHMQGLGYTAEVSVGAHLARLAFESPRLEHLASLDRSGIDISFGRNELYAAMDHVLATTSHGSDQSQWSKLVGFKTT